MLFTFHIGAQRDGLASRQHETLKVGKVSRGSHVEEGSALFASQTVTASENGDVEEEGAGALKNQANQLYEGVDRHRTGRARLKRAVR
jgi:hypothetical protein